MMLYRYDKNAVLHDLLKQDLPHARIRDYSTHFCILSSTNLKLHFFAIWCYLSLFRNMTTLSLNFPGPLSTKRRRMRSGGAATNITNNGNATTTAEKDPLEPSTPSASAAAQSQATTMNDDENISEQKTTQTSKCKGATTIPIFLKSKFKQYSVAKSMITEISSLTSH